MRSWSIDIAWALLAGAIAVSCWSLSCGSNVAVDAARYSTNLEECNRNAKNLCESIACENHYRAAEKRPLRAIPPHCAITDAGVE
jgi:hypothetical protein